MVTATAAGSYTARPTRACSGRRTWRRARRVPQPARDDQFRVRGAVQVVLRSGESCRLRMRLHTADGTVRRFEGLVHAVREDDADEHGAIIGAVIAARDVTELSDREEQVELAAQAFERMAEAVMITNAAGRILTVNQSYTRITGYAASEVLGRHESEFRGALQPPSFYDDLYAEVAAQRPLGRHQLVQAPRRHAVPRVAQRERGARRRGPCHAPCHPVPRAGRPRRRRDARHTA